MPAKIIFKNPPQCSVASVERYFYIIFTRCSLYELCNNIFEVVKIQGEKKLAVQCAQHTPFWIILARKQLTFGNVSMIQGRTCRKTACPSRPRLGASSPC